jgi:Zn-dependent protease with chaperone function
MNTPTVGLAAYGIIHVLVTWMLTYTVHGIICGLIAVVLARIIGFRPNVRTWIWRAALILPFCTAALTLAARTDRWIGMVPALRARGYLGGTTQVRLNRDVDRRGVASSTVRINDPAADRLALLLLGVVGAVSVALLARYGWHRRRAIHALGARRTLTPAELQSIIGGSAARLDGIRITMSPAVFVPLALPRREICIPADGFIELPPAQRRGVLLHEAAHLARNDPAWMTIGALLRAICWFQPVNAVIARAMLRDAEYAADHMAVTETGDPLALVASLAAFARLFDVVSAERAGIALVRSSAVVDRARKLLGADATRQAPIVFVAGASAFAALLLLGALAALPAPTTAPLLGDRPRRAPGGVVVEEEEVVRLVGRGPAAPGRPQ